MSHSAINNANLSYDTQVDTTRMSTASLTTDLDAMRQLFSLKEQEMVAAVTRVEELTRQLELLRTAGGGGGGGEGHHRNELDKLRRELLVSGEGGGRCPSGAIYSRLGYVK